MRSTLTRPLIATLIACAIVTTRLDAQRIRTTLTPGTRVRVAYRELASETITGPPKPVAGELIAIRGDSIDVLPDESSRVARFLVSNLDHIDYSRGEYHPVVKSMVISTGLGLAFGYFYDRQARSIDCVRCSTNRVGQGVAIGAGLGALGGAIVGSLISVDRWVTVRLR